MANTHSHLTLSDRIYIAQALERRMKFKDIALFIEKDPTTVSKEIRRHRVAKESGRKTALRENRSTCTKQHMCHQRYRNRMCGKCTPHYCHSYCEDYSAPVCRRLTSPPMFAMAVEFGAADRTQSIITAHRSPRKATTNCCQNPAGGLTKQPLNWTIWIVSYPRF